MNFSHPERALKEIKKKRAITTPGEERGRRSESPRL